MTKTDSRDTAVLLPFGVALGLFGRISGGISTTYAFWQEANAFYQQLGPLRLDLTVRLWPLLGSSGGAEISETGQTHYAPPRGLRIGLSYQHELRVWKFDGANSLGLLSDLAVLRLIGSRMFGSLHLAASVGALFDWRGQFATGEAAAHVGLYVPGFSALKIYVEALGQGVPAYVQNRITLPSGGDPAPIHPQGLIGLGLSFRPHARVDFGLAVHRGFGGLAPWIVTANVLTLSLGKAYQGRVGTPIAQLAADAAAEFGSWAIEQWKTIDPYLKHDCVQYDDNHQPTGQLGELSPDGTACIYQGLRVPIGPRFWHNKADTVLCNDKSLTDCFLFRTHKQAAWEPIHPLLVHSDCFAYHNGQPWMHIGAPTTDKQGCERDGHVIPIGQALKPDHSTAGFYCYDEPDRKKNQTKKLWCLQPPEHPQADGQYLLRRLAGGVDRASEERARMGAAVRQVLDEGAHGIPLHATTPVQEAVQAGRQTVERVKDFTRDDAKQTYHAVLNQARSWLNKPLREHLGDLAEEGGDTLGSASTYIPGGALTGRGRRLVVEGAEVVGDAAKAGKKVQRGVKLTEHAVAEAAQKEKQAQNITRTAERSVAESKAAESFLREQEAYGGRLVHKPPREAKPLPALDRTGKVHGELPRAEDLGQYSPYELRQLQKELKQSVQERIRVTVEKGPHKPHGERQRAEQELIRQIDKHLEDL